MRLKEDMAEDSEDWKLNSVRSAQEACDFFSNKGKFERELWVAENFLKRMRAKFTAEELKPSSEPYDVTFRDLNFQIKEAIPEGRRRQLEYKERLAKAEMASDKSDLLRQYDLVELNGQEIFLIAAELAKNLSDQNIYGPKEACSIDLLIYVNYPKHYEIEPYSGKLSGCSFRSVSYISNRFASVIYAISNAPKWLKSNLGVVLDKTQE